MWCRQRQARKPDAAGVVQRGVEPDPQLCQRGDRSVGQVAKDFDLTETAVRELVRQAERDTGTACYKRELTAVHWLYVLRMPARPDTTEGVAQEIRRIASSAELWAPGPALTPGGPPSDVAACEGFCLYDATP